MLRALGSASCDIMYETGSSICYQHWVLRLVISYTRQGYDLSRPFSFCVLRYHIRDREYELFRALRSASCDITHETGGTIYFGHWILRLVISVSRQEIRFVTFIGFCVVSYHTRDRRYDLLRALVSASCGISHETGGTICYVHWILGLVISRTR